MPYLPSWDEWIEILTKMKGGILMKKKVVVLMLCAMTLYSCLLIGCEKSVMPINTEPAKTDMTNTQNSNTENGIHFTEDANVIQLSGQENITEKHDVMLPVVEKTKKIETGMVLNCDNDSLKGHFLVDSVKEGKDGIHVEAHSISVYDGQPVWDLPEEMEVTDCTTIQLNPTEEAKCLKEGDLFYLPEAYDVYRVGSVDVEKDAVNVTTDDMTFEEKMGLISSINIEGSGTADASSFFSSEGVTITTD